MSTILVSFIAFVVFTAAAVGLVMLVYLRSKSASPKHSAPPPAAPSGLIMNLPFRLLDVILPAGVFALALISAFFFFGRIPQQVAYHFAADGSGDLWIDRGMLLTTMLLPQLLLASLSVVIAVALLRVGSRFVNEGKISAPLLRGVISMMSNMIALPQLILLFAMLDIFLYNAYRFHLFPLYIFAIVVMIFGGILMGFFFFRVITKARNIGK